MSQVLFSLPAAMLLNKKWAKGTVYFEEDGLQFSSPGPSFQQRLSWREVTYTLSEEKVAGLSLLSTKKLTLKLTGPEGALPKLALDLEQQSKLQGSLDRLIVDSKSRYLEEQLQSLNKAQKANDTKKTELDTLKARLDRQSRELMDKQTRLDDQSLSQEKRQLELDDLEKERQKDTQALAKEKKDLETQRKGLEKEKKSLQSEKKDCETQKKSLQAEKEKLEKLKSQAQEEKERLEQLQKEAESHRQSLEETLQRLQRESQEIKSQNQELLASCKDLTAQNQELSLQGQSQEEKARELIEENQGLKSQAKLLSQENQSLERELTELKEELKSQASQQSSKETENQSESQTHTETELENTKAQEAGEQNPEEIKPETGKEETPDGYITLEGSIKLPPLMSEEVFLLKSQLQKLEDTCASLRQQLEAQGQAHSCQVSSLEGRLRTLEGEKQLLLEEKQELENSWQDRLEEELSLRIAQLTYPNPPETGEKPEDSESSETPESLDDKEPEEASLPETDFQQEDPSSPKVIAFINMKGGVAKTTTLVGTATLLAGTYGKKVLVIDLDPQTNCTTMLIGERKWIEVNGKTPQENKTLYRLYKDAIDKESLFSMEDCLQKQVSDIKNVKTIDLLPSSLNTVELEESFYKIPEKRRYQLIREAIRDIRSDYDYILIDCPPNLGPITLNGLAIAGAYIIPAIPDNLSTYGIPQIIARIHKFSQKMNREIKCLGIVATKVAPNFATHKRILKAYSDPKPLLRQVQRIENNPDAEPITLFDTTFKENNFVSSAGEYQELGVSTVRKKWGYESQNGQYSAFEAFTQEVMDRAQQALEK